MSRRLTLGLSCCHRLNVAFPFSSWAWSIRSREEFLAKVHTHFPKACPINPEVAARAVFQVIEKHITAGEIRDVIEAMPQEIRTLWSQPQARLQGVV
jgi:uncharacterized protein (DUF2267 family)